MFRLREWFKAWRDDKRWPLCGWCWWRILWADDCGFMFLYPYPPWYPWRPVEEQKQDLRNGKPCCRHCYFGLPGVAHTNRHGVGER